MKKIKKLVLRLSCMWYKHNLTTEEKNSAEMYALGCTDLEMVKSVLDVETLPKAFFKYADAYYKEYEEYMKERYEKCNNYLKSRKEEIDNAIKRRLP